MLSPPQANVNPRGLTLFTLTETVPALDASDNPVWRTVSKVWYTDDQDDVLDPIVSQTDRTPDGLQSWSWQIGTGTTHTLTDLEPATPKAWTTVTTHPDDTKTIQIHTNGRLARVEQRSEGNPGTLIAFTEYGYEDANNGIPGRLRTTTDSRTGPTTTEYLSLTADFIASVEDPGERTTFFAYDIRGRQATTILPNTTQTHTAYTPRGEVEARWGSQTYPEFRTYDYAGRLLTLRTTPDMTGPDDSPVNDGGTVTLWKYSSSTGLLINKFHDYRTGNLTDGPTYTHTNAGRLKTRLWKRGVLTTYGYDSGGRLETTTYTNDPAATPGVTIVLDALGRRKSITNGIATSVFAYDPATLAIDTETVTYTLPGQAAFTRVIDHSAIDLGRPTGWELKDGQDVENEVEYRYHANEGRLHQIESPAGIFTYGYEDNSLHLLATVTKSADGENPALVATRAYDDTRDALDSIENKAGTIVRSSYDYSVVNGGVNSLGQRMGVRATFNLGGAHTANPGDTTWGYDNLGQLTSASHSTVNDIDRAYQFDDIGNRLFAEKGAAQIPATPGTNTTGYTPNPLNQYDAITSYDGEGDPAASVVPVFDDDGNMEQGPLAVSPNANCALVWDAVNRLIEVKNASNVTLVEYTYDALSRRIARSVTGSPPTLYVYDGWNCIAEYNGGTLSIVRTWGMDLSGTLQGAGGVGGLLAEIHGADAFHPTYDGNGNISEYLEANGDVAAHYEYDPFGNIVEESYATGFDATSFTYKFSTKPLDSSTGLYYYGYRWYDPITGRWPSRDPIEELGGVNLYALISNDAINDIDILGLAMGPEGRGNHMGGPEWTCESAREHLNEVVEKWKNQYPAAAKILGKFLEGSGDDHDFSDDAAFVNEVKEKGKSKICGRISAEVCKDPKRGEKNINLDSVNIRWNPSLPGRNAMFYAYGGARLSVTGTATVGRALFWNGTFDVTLGDTYVFLRYSDGKGKGLVSNTFGEAYRAGRHLQEKCKGQNPAAPFSHTTSFSIDCNGCCARAPMPYEGPGF